MTRWWEWKKVFELERASTALLVIHMQKAFVAAQGRESPLGVDMAERQVPTIRRLVDHCRSNEIPVVFAAFTVVPGKTHPFYMKRCAERGVDLTPPSCYLWRGKAETEIIDELAPLEGEEVIETVGYDCFADSGLDTMLRSRGITYLIVVGTVVNWCVDSTLRGAYHHNYNCVVVADAVSGYTHAGLSGELWHDVALDFFAESLAQVSMADDVIMDLTAHH